MTNTSVMGTRGVGKAIFKAAFTQLNQETRVFLVPVIGFIGHILVAVGLLVGWLLFIPTMVTVKGSVNTVDTILGIIGGLLFGLIYVFTQAIVMVVANEQYEGRKITLSSAFALAMKKFGPLAFFGIIEATVGMVLRALRDDRNPISKIISFFLSIAWAIASYFSIPLILFADAGPFGSVKKSIELVRSKWGDATRVNVFAGALFVLAWLATFAGFIGGVIWLIQATNQSGDHHIQFISALVTIMSSLLGMMLVGLVQSTVMAYVRVALYRYVTGQKIDGFSPEMLSQAMVGKSTNLPGLLRN